MKLTKCFLEYNKNDRSEPLKEYGLDIIRGITRTRAILASQTDFLELYKVVKSDEPQNQKEQIVKQLTDLKIKFYQNRINSRYKGEKLGCFLSDDEIILKGVNYGKFENIERNLYYCLDNIDLILNGFLAEPLIYRIPTKHDKEKAKKIYKELAPYKKINTDILKQYKTLNTDYYKPFYEVKSIPLSDYKANSALLYTLMHERNKTDKGTNGQGYKYRDFIISIIQEYIYCNFELNSYHRTTQQPLNFTINTKEKTKKTSQNLYENSFIRQLILDNFLPYRNADF